MPALSAWASNNAAYCLGCCWLLFVILFPLGMMNIAVLALITLLIFAEKSTTFGRQIAALAAFALIAYGALVVFVPDALPMAMDNSPAMDAGGMDGSSMQGWLHDRASRQGHRRRPGNDEQRPV